MTLDRYELKAESDFTAFEFVSEGPKGSIVKAIQFQQTEVAGVYNLAFGDYDSSTGNIDDLIVTDNKDTEKVLATVVRAVYLFTEQHPDVWVYAVGSTAIRMRLYRMSINRYFDLAKADFDILGEEESEWK